MNDNFCFVVLYEQKGSTRLNHVVKLRGEESSILIYVYVYEYLIDARVMNFFLRTPVCIIILYEKRRLE